MMQQFMFPSNSCLPVTVVADLRNVNFTAPSMCKPRSLADCCGHDQRDCFEPEGICVLIDAVICQSHQAVMQLMS